ncbi:Uncharacterised protein [Vibrio cholerae]|nr:Uncharacterised protein [Vibrio cholerae]
MTTPPTERRAILFDISSEINAPPKPNTAAITNRPDKLPGCMPVTA